MKICLIEYMGKYIYCIYSNGKYYSIASMLGVLEEDLEKNFYSMYGDIIGIVPHEKSEIKPEVIKYGIPIPGMRSVRDFYSFEDHVKNARKNKGLDMIPEWYKFPVFYFSCTPNIYPSGQEIKYPEKSKAFDYEMEVAAVIGSRVQDCHRDCMDSIFGFIMMNDWSLRDIQKEEMKVMLGPAKGKDYATSFGPFLVTRDEILRDSENGKINIEMRGYVNGNLYSSNNLKNIYFSFNSMLERASESVPLLPGDVIGSGTFGTGCLLELGKYPWLKPGDEVKFESPQLGTLINRVV
ncbi:MAG: fumarylacetoacetate hydrolase family protein [Ferroplasma sp.]|uniref:fumarylacetoacetate hydrolase family protein n=1 Tax=Ferroplasma sp. TaxID=2591003 RepID=UPI002814DFD9|nr:fumarylacetoacetate hydrolase family protein [Ferroplasma sp.]WMT50448.1 MAG: fumarylacetoacetate hydrolase family protein [Ferroplasma sp.]